MNEQMLEKVREVLAERRKAIIESKDPKAVARMYLQQAGYLDETGEVSETFRGGIVVSKLEASPGTGVKVIRLPFGIVRPKRRKDKAVSGRHVSAETGKSRRKKS